jgi:hypothetical protein
MTAGEMKQFSGNDNDDKRLAELQRLGALMVTGQTVCSVTGRKAQVWAPNPEFMNF